LPWEELLPIPKKRSVGISLEKKERSAPRREILQNWLLADSRKSKKKKKSTRRSIFLSKPAIT